MKRIVLYIIFPLFFFTGFSQTAEVKPLGVKNSLFEENAVAAELKVYPNPIKDQRVTIEFNTREIAEIKLANITGREVLAEKFTFPENKKTIRLNNVPNGIYLLRIKTTDEQLVVKKLIVANE